jgi:hypothetical protein
MIRPWTLTDEVTVYPMESTETDRYGNEVEGKGKGVTIRARVEPLRDIELQEGRDTFISLYTLYTAPCDELTGTAVVEWDSDEWEVLGEPKSFKHINNQPSHVETYIRRIEG